MTSRERFEEPGEQEEGPELSAYLSRLAYTGPLTPTVELLEVLVARHMATIPFEAIDVMLGQGVALDPAIMDRKMLDEGRGGYCFEHANLLGRVLRRLGYRVEPLLARVWVHRDPKDGVPAASHAALNVQAGDRLWLVDVGFGAMMPNVPLAWQLDEPQQTAFGDFRLVRSDDGYMVETARDDLWMPLYEILDFHWKSVDFDVANHYVAEHPESHFRHDLVVARTEDETRYTLSGNRFRITRRGNVIEERLLDAHELGDALGRHFGLSLRAEWQPMLERVAAQGGR